MRTFAAAAILGVLAIGSGTAHVPDEAFAWPRFAMFYGGVLEEQRAFLLEQEQVMGLTAALAEAPREATAGLAGRRHVLVALYWNNRLWEPYVADAELRRKLPLPSLPWSLPPSWVEDEAKWVEPARFYPATSAAAAIFEYLAGFRPGANIVNDEGLALLAKHGVPVRLPKAPG